MGKMGKMATEEVRLLHQELARDGVAFRIDLWPPKVTLYKPDGEALPNLPADPYSMGRYLKRGLTLAPPAAPVAQPVRVVGVEEAKAERTFPCPSCDLVAKARIGLISHILRKHPDVFVAKGRKRKHPSLKGGKDGELPSNN
mgnify:CR=1 FL=1